MLELISHLSLQHILVVCGTCDITFRRIRKKILNKLQSSIIAMLVDVFPSIFDSGRRHFASHLIEKLPVQSKYKLLIVSAYKLHFLTEFSKSCPTAQRFRKTSTDIIVKPIDTLPCELRREPKLVHW